MSGEKPLNIVIIGKDFGFPFGGAAATRIRLIALGLVEQGIKVKVLHLNSLSNYYSCFKNINSRDSYKGIDFEYTAGTPIVKRKFVFYEKYLRFKGVFIGFLRLIQLHSKKRLDCVYLYGRSCVIFTFVIILCRIIRVPVILEITEWLPATPMYSRIEKELYLRFILKKVNGVIVISENIFEEVVKLHATEKHKIPILKVPILVDIDEWQVPENQDATNLNKDRYILWCGDLRGYINNVKFLMDVMVELLHKNIKVKLRLIGIATPMTINQLRDYQLSIGLRVDQIEILGYMNMDELKKQFREAAALLLPLLENIQKDLFRFPHKLGEYLASGRPVVSSNIGEVSKFLKHGVNAILCKVNDIKDFANGVEILLNSPRYAERIGKAGRELSETIFDYRLHSPRIMGFIWAKVINKNKL